LYIYVCIIVHISIDISSLPEADLTVQSTRIDLGDVEVDKIIQGSVIVSNNSSSEVTFEISEKPVSENDPILETVFYFILFYFILFCLFYFIFAFAFAFQSQSFLFFFFS